MAVMFVLVVTPAAEAHTVSGVSATNYRSEIVSVSPPVPGVVLRLREVGTRVELVNHTGVDVVVLGYQGEPYRRVGPGGVYENRNSPSVLLNRAATTTSVVAPTPPRLDPSEPPSWHKISDGRSTRWRDHRIGWEGPDPPAVRRSPGSERVVGRWTIPLVFGSVPVAATGLIRWVPGTSVVPWLGGALGIAVVVASLGWSRRWGPLLSGAVAALVANDAVHSFSAAAPAGDAIAVLLLKVLVGGIVLTLAWAAGLWSVGQLQRGREFGLVAAAFAGIAIGLYALSDVVSMGRSQIPYAFPVVTARAAIALSLGMGAGLVAAVAIVFARHPELRPKVATPPAIGPPPNGPPATGD